MMHGSYWLNEVFDILLNKQFTMIAKVEIHPELVKPFSIK